MKVTPSFEDDKHAWSGPLGQAQALREMMGGRAWELAEVHDARCDGRGVRTSSIPGEPLAGWVALGKSLAFNSFLLCEMGVLGGRAGCDSDDVPTTGSQSLRMMSRLSASCLVSSSVTQGAAETACKVPSSSPLCLHPEPHLSGGPFCCLRLWLPLAHLGASPGHRSRKCLCKESEDMRALTVHQLPCQA